MPQTTPHSQSFALTLRDLYAHYADRGAVERELPLAEYRRLVRKLRAMPAARLFRVARALSEAFNREGLVARLPRQFRLYRIASIAHHIYWGS